MGVSEEDVKNDGPVAFLIGTVDRDGVVSALKAAGRTYAVRRIDSSAANWESICDQLESEQVACVLLKLTGATYGYLCEAEYEDARERLLSFMARVPHTVFVHEQLLSGEDDEVASDVDLDDDHDDFVRIYFTAPPQSQRTQVNSMLAERGIQVLPYKSNAELTALASNFIGQVEQGLLFRIYIPSHQLWASETDRLLTLFRDYLANVGHRDVTLGQRRTTRGTIYEFFSAIKEGNQNPPTSSLSAEFGEFSRLLDLCMTDASKAEQLLRDKCVDPKEINSVLVRYSKEARRLQVDLRQSREQKLLSIRHRLESDLGELLPIDFAPLDLARLVDATVPAIEGIGSTLTAGHQALQLTAAQGGTVTVNFSPQFVQSMNAVVAQEISGDVHLSQEEHQILQLIREHAPAREAELSSAVRELADDLLPKPERLGAKQKLKAFLAQLASKVPDIAAGVLQAYLEKRFGL
jgi:hypothetical protein